MLGNLMVNPVASTTKKASVKACENCVEGVCKARKRAKWSICIRFLQKNYILASQNLLYQLYYTILQHTQHPNFYFPIQYIKIIYLHNKI